MHSDTIEQTLMLAKNCLRPLIPSLHLLSPFSKPVRSPFQKQSYILSNGSLESISKSHAYSIDTYV